MLSRIACVLFVVAVVSSSAAAVEESEEWGFAHHIRHPFGWGRQKPQCRLQRGREYQPSGEAQAIETIKGMIAPQQASDKANKGRALRFFHAKAHGCVDALFKVNSDLPEQYRHGVFVPGKVYPAKVRFSNGQTEVNPDKTPDTRGLAMKLLGIPGKKIIGDDFGAQDFVSAVGNTFLFSKASGMADALTLLGVKGFWNGLAAKSKLVWRYPGSVKAIIKTLYGGSKVRNPFAGTYHSQTPYALGPNQAIKFRFIPCSDDNLEGTKDGDNYMRTNLDEQLKQGPTGCFRFEVQLQGDPCEDSVEDSLKQWKGKFVQIAKLFIRSGQKVNYADRVEECDNLSMNPWHSIDAHRPLGINRIRRAIYKFSSDNRHKLNNQDVFNPDPKAVLRSASLPSKTGALRRGPPAKQEVAGGFLATDSDYSDYSNQADQGEYGYDQNPYAADEWAA